MTPKEKADYLVKKYLARIHMLSQRQAKWCAEVHCEEMIAEFEEMGRTNLAGIQFVTKIEFWEEVKREIGVNTAPPK